MHYRFILAFVLFLRLLFSLIIQVRLELIVLTLFFLRLLFCTTGVLLRRLANDAQLAGVSHIIVDEIHERGINEDFLLIILKDLLVRNASIRVILMSATLNAARFSEYLGGCPTTHIPGFTHPVKDVFLEEILEHVPYDIPAHAGGGGGGGGGGGWGGGGRGRMDRGRRSVNSLPTPMLARAWMV